MDKKHARFVLCKLLYVSLSLTKAVFGSRKSISGKYSIFWKCYFPEGKMFLCVWLYFKKFSEKYFLVFGKCYKEKTNPSPPRTKPRLTLDARDLAAPDKPITTAPSIAISRSTAPLREIAIGVKARSRSTTRSREASIAISRSTAPIAIGAKASSRSRIAIDDAGACERHRLELGCANGADWVSVSLLRSRSLSLSLSGIHLK